MSILTITPSPALDITYQITALQLGESHRVHPPFMRAGGKGINVARVLTSQGYRTHAVTTAGGRNGEILREDLEHSGIEYTAVPVHSETRKSLAFVDSNGSATLFNERGRPVSSSQQEELIAVARAQSTGSGVAVISGSFPENTAPTFLRDMIHGLAGTPTIVDTSGPLLISAAEAGADLLKPNLEELREAVGISDPVEAARALIDKGAQAVLVSLGEAGMTLVQKSTTSVYYARLQKPLVGNPTGAGDAAVAAVATFMANGQHDEKNVDSMLRRAVSWSAAAVLTPHAGEISELHHELEASVLLDTKEKP